MKNDDVKKQFAIVIRNAKITAALFFILLTPSIVITVKELDEMLAVLDEPEIKETTVDSNKHQSAEEIPIESMTMNDLSSRTLEELESSRRPKAKTVCEDCPNSVWFASRTELKCYCRVMYLITWSSKEQQQIELCDGIYLGQD